MTSRKASGAQGPGSPCAPTRRVFFSLWPDAALRTALARATHKAVSTSAGRPVPSESLHATLVFIGSVPEQRIPELEAIGARRRGVVLRGAALCGDGLAHSAAAHLRSHRVLAEAADHLRYRGRGVCRRRRGCRGAGRRAEKGNSRRRIYSRSQALPPHVTVARKVARPTPTLDMHSVPWSCTGFALVDSRTGAGGAIYSVINSWALDTLRNS